MLIVAPLAGRSRRRVARAPDGLCRIPARQRLRRGRRRFGARARNGASRPAILDGEILRWSLKALLCGRGDEWRRFDALFDAYFLPPNKRAFADSDVGRGRAGVGRQRCAPAMRHAAAGAGAGPRAQPRDDDDGAARHGASREESLASTDFRELDRADQVRDIEALMRRFARRLKHLQLRREARFASRPPARPAGHDTPERGERRHAVAARLEGPPPRAPAPGAAARRQPVDEPVQLLLPAPRARAVRASSPTCIASSSTRASPASAKRCATRIRGDRRSACTCLPPDGAAARASANACRNSIARHGAAPRAFAHRRDHRQRRLRHRRAGASGAGARRAAAAGAAHRLAQSAAEPARISAPRAAACRRPCRTSICFAPGADLASIERMLPQTHRGAAMTNDELLELARELNGRGEPYALVTVVRAIAPTSAYLGAQAIVLADGTLHGWIGGGCAKDVVIGAARERDRARRAEARAHPQRPDPARRRMSSSTRCPARATARSSSSSSPTAPAARCACSGARPPPTRRASLRSGSGSGSPTAPDEAPVVLVATQGQGDEEALERALAQPGDARADDRKPAQGGEAARRDAHARHRRGAARALCGAGGPGCRRQDARRDCAGGDRRRARVAARSCADAGAGPDAGDGDARHHVAAAHPAEHGRGSRPSSSTRSAEWPSTPPAPKHVETYEGVAYYFCCDGCWTTFRQNPAKYAAIHRASKGNASTRRA